MTGLLEIREKLKMIYSKYEALLFPLVKFLLAFARTEYPEWRDGIYDAA